MNSPSDPVWQRLVDAARRAPAAEDEQAPFGFAVRVAAQAAAMRQQQSAWHRLVMRVSIGALATSCALAVVSGVWSYRSAQGFFAADHSATAAVVVPGSAPAISAEHVIAPESPAPAAAATTWSTSTDDPVAELIDLIS